MKKYYKKNKKKIRETLAKNKPIFSLNQLDSLFKSELVLE